MEVTCLGKNEFYTHTHTHIYIYIYIYKQRGIKYYSEKKLEL